jgi:hypothetical protein
MNVLIVGSGKSAHQIKDLNLTGLVTVAVNHGWMANDQWDLWIKSIDFAGTSPGDTVIIKEKTTDYKSATNKYGGQSACGFSIMLCSSYYVLDRYKPSNIFYLGADMNYTPDSDGATHIYGKGIDITKNGISDPDRMASIYGKDDPKYLENIYNRFKNIAQENDCEVWNLSNDSDTRLPYTRIDYNDLYEFSRKSER